MTVIICLKLIKKMKIKNYLILLLPTVKGTNGSQIYVVKISINLKINNK